MRISEAAKATGLSVSNIRFYEKKGLLVPVAEIAANIRSYGFVWTRGIVFWLVWMAGLWTAFFQFRRKRRP